MTYKSAKEHHNKWLLKNNVHPNQIKKRKKFSNKPKDFGVAKSYYGDQANTIAPPVLVTSIWEKLRTGNETAETIRQIKEKASRCAPAYNKGGFQVLSEKEMKHAGQKYGSR